MSAPTIEKQPSNATVYEPQHAAFGVSTSGTSPLSFQWQSSDDGITWTDIPNATSFMYVIPSTTTSMSGEHFRCVVTNGEGSATSNAATLTVSSASSWTSGTDEQIAALLDAAASGEIDLQEDAGWAVGHVRTISVSDWTDGNDVLHAAENLRIAISQFGDYNNCGCLLQFDFEECFTDTQRMSSENTTVGGYGATEMYADTLPALVNALPNWLKDRLKNFSVPTSKGGNEIQTIEMVGNNKLALRSEVEVMGTNAFSTAGEGTQVEYYESVSNRIKTRGISGSGVGWWERSPYLSLYANAWCYYGGMGTAATGPTYQSYISPFGCLGGIVSAPVITTQPESKILEKGDPVSVSVVAAGDDLLYQWQYWEATNSEWISLVDEETAHQSGTRTPTFLYDGPDGFPYPLRCGIVSGNTTVYSDPAWIYCIDSQPQDKSVTEGDTTSFNFNPRCMGGSSLGDVTSYQWQVSTDGGQTWNNFSDASDGATSHTVYFTARLNQNGNKFRCVFTSSEAGTATSDAATLTVTPKTPTITSQPQDQTAIEGNTATFVVAATGGELRYSWEKSADNDPGPSGDWRECFDSAGYRSGSNTNTLQQTAADANVDTGYYRCFVYITGYWENGVYSDPARLTVIAVPHVLIPPRDKTVTEGRSATFSVTVLGAYPAYQWQVSTDNGTSWSDITGAEQDSCTVPATTAAMNGNKYRCVVSNAAGSTTSDAATLTVNPVITLPVITVQPQDQTVTAGQSATFSVTATGLNLAYQWFTYKNGTWYAISGANASSYTAAGTVDMSGAEYHCMVSNAAGAVISDDATLTVTSASQITTPVITVQPQALTVEAGDVASFLIAAEGGALSYQWQIRRSTEWYDITGADSFAYNFPTQEADNGANLRCVVSNAAGTVYSNAATLTVQAQPTPTPPTPLVVPGLRLMIDGVDITRYVRYQGFKWSRNDVDGPNAGRNIIAEMIRDRVATKIRIDITCVPLTKDEHNMIMNLIMPEFVTVQYDDPVYGFTSKIMYANNNSSEYCIKKRNGREYWYNVSFPLIEK